MRISHGNRNYHSKISTQSGQNFRELTSNTEFLRPLIVITPGNHCVSCV